MPELPEVETVRLGLSQIMVGRRFHSVHVRRRDLRVPVASDFADRLEGLTLLKLSRRAKYLIGEFDDGTVLITHLGMSGRLLITRGTTNNRFGQFTSGAHGHQNHEHIVFDLGDGIRVRFSDPRRFGLMVLTDKSSYSSHPLICRLGPEPMENSFNGTVLSGVLKGRKTPIKSALLDQTIISGLGNIYACEALFEAGISPRRSSLSVQGMRADKLATAIKEVLLRAIKAGGSSLRDHIAPSGEKGYFQHSFSVYGREGQR